MKDKNGKELHIGQRVIFTWSTDPDVYSGIVVRFTKLKVEVNYKYHPQQMYSKSLKYPHQLMIIEC